MTSDDRLTQDSRHDAWRRRRRPARRERRADRRHVHLADRGLDGGQRRARLQLDRLEALEHPLQRGRRAARRPAHLDGVQRRAAGARAWRTSATRRSTRRGAITVDRDVGGAAERGRRQRERRRGRGRPALHDRRPEGREAVRGATKKAGEKKKIDGYGASGLAGGGILASNKVSSFAKAFIDFTARRAPSRQSARSPSPRRTPPASTRRAPSSSPRSCRTTSRGIVDIVNQFIIPGDYDFTTASGVQCVSGGDLVRARLDLR